MVAPNFPPSLDRRLRNIERVLQSLSSSEWLRRATIRGGTIRVLLDSPAPGVDGAIVGMIGVLDTAGRRGIAALSTLTGNIIFRAGQIHSIWGADEEGVQILRNDGTIALELSTPTGNPSQSLSLYDRFLNELVGEDAASGQGLSRPYIPIPTVNFDMSTASHTGNTTWTDLEGGFAYKQHPVIVAAAYAQTDAATTGQVRLWDGVAGVQVGAPVAVAAGATISATWGPFTIAGAHEASLDIRLQGQVTSGTGQIRARYAYLIGRQS